jgi:hypothetical protein
MSNDIEHGQWSQWLAVLPERTVPNDAPPSVNINKRPKRLPRSAWADPVEPTICQQNGRHVWSPLKPTCILCGERP